MPDTELSITEVLADLAARGFDADFHVAHDAPALVCGHCGDRIDPAEVEVVELYRFEGSSDPADEAIVMALRCPRCGGGGTLVAGYGATADLTEAEVLANLLDRRRDRPATGA